MSLYAQNQNDSESLITEKIGLQKIPSRFSSKYNDRTELGKLKTSKKIVIERVGKF